MRFAIAVEQGQVADHFGRCEGFLLVDIDDGRELGREWLDCPSHEPGLLPRVMSEHQVDLVVCGGMGPRAQQLLAQFGLRALYGVAGPVDQVLLGLADGSIAAGDSTCHHEQ